MTKTVEEKPKFFTEMRKPTRDEIKDLIDSDTGAIELVVGIRLNSLVECGGIDQLNDLVDSILEAGGGVISGIGYKLVGTTRENDQDLVLLRVMGGASGLIADDDASEADVIRQLAKDKYSSTDINIDDDAVVSVGNDGAFVAAWVFVSKDVIPGWDPDDGEVCDECGAVIPDDASDMVNNHHKESCSLHPSAVT